MALSGFAAVGLAYCVSIGAFSAWSLWTTEPQKAGAIVVLCVIGFLASLILAWHDDGRW